jgi:hypothetical protein
VDLDNFPQQGGDDHFARDQELKKAFFVGMRDVLGDKPMRDSYLPLGPAEMFMQHMLGGLRNYDEHLYRDKIIRDNVDSEAWWNAAWDQKNPDRLLSRQIDDLFASGMASIEVPLMGVIGSLPEDIWEKMAPSQKVGFLNSLTVHIYDNAEFNKFMEKSLGINLAEHDRDSVSGLFISEALWGYSAGLILINHDVPSTLIGVEKYKYPPGTREYVLDTIVHEAEHAGHNAVGIFSRGIDDPYYKTVATISDLMFTIDHLYDFSFVDSMGRKIDLRPGTRNQIEQLFPGFKDVDYYSMPTEILAFSSQTFEAEELAKAIVSRSKEIHNEDHQLTLIEARQLADILRNTEVMSLADEYIQDMAKEILYKHQGYIYSPVVHQGHLGF